jgi:hypothetical protein
MRLSPSIGLGYERVSCHVIGIFSVFHKGKFMPVCCQATVSYRCA